MISQVLVAEIAKLRADSQSHIHNSSATAQSEISRMQSELQHHQKKYDDLQRAYSILEKSISPSVVEPRNSNGVTWNIGAPNERDRKYEATIEGGIGTMTPSNISARSSEEVSKFINDCTAQMEYYKVLFSCYLAF